MRCAVASTVVGCLVALASPALGQADRRTDRPADGPVVTDSTVLQSGGPPIRRFSWSRFVGGFLASIAAHEAGHLVTALAVGSSPSIGFDTGRPVVYSGIDETIHPHRQFAFSASGMAVQLVVNEIILDWPRSEPGVAGEFERGILAGGIGTVLFYFTVGRQSAVSDVQNMADNSGLSKWALTAIFGGVAATDVIRIALDQRYAHLFAFPGPSGTLHLGVTIGQ